MAVDSPYFTVSDVRGAFAISGVPAGSYTYHAWRPGGAEITGTVTVAAGRGSAATADPAEFAIKWP
jgi:hypothetical protein